MKIKTIIILLLSLLVLLVGLDLITGIWYWNRLHLVFNPNNFNNIFSPIIGLVAVIIYTLALKTTIKQNKIILSQSIKPYFENEFQELKQEALSYVIGQGFGEHEKSYNLLNYISLIKQTTIDLLKDKHYLEDLDDFEKYKSVKNLEYYESRSYFSKVHLLNGFSLGLSIFFFYQKLDDFISEINQSQMLNFEKNLLKKRVRRTFVEEYIQYVSFMDNHELMFNPIPLLYNKQGNIEFSHLNKTEFRKYSDIFKKSLSIE